MKPGWHLRELSSDAFARLAGGVPPAGFALPETPLAPPEILAMLAEIAARVSDDFTPCAWLVVDGNRIGGLLSLTGVPADGELTIGYGMAPSEQGRGGASAAVAALCRWAAEDDRVAALRAETSVDNPASQRVLAGNGFDTIGQRCDPEDGELLCWRWSAH